MKTLVIVISSLVVLATNSCGFFTAITDPKVVQNGSGLCEQAAAPFTANLKPAIDASCSAGGSCHGGTASPSLNNGADEANRSILIATVGRLTAEEFVKKLDGTTSHGGGTHIDQNNLTETGINEWFSAEASCQ